MIKALNWTALVLLIIGGLNWLMVGSVRFDLFFLITGPMTLTTRSIYVLVGVAAVYIAAISRKLIK